MNNNKKNVDIYWLSNILESPELMEEKPLKLFKSNLQNS